MLNLRRAAKTAFVYFTGNILSKLVVFILFPLYTIYIDPVQYGNYDLAYSIINLVTPIAFVQIWDAVFRFSFDFEGLEDKYILITNSFVICAMGIPVYIIFMGVANYFMRFEYYEYIIIYGLVYAFQYIYAYAARVFLDNTLYVFSGVVNTIVSVVLNVIFVVIFHYDVSALYISAVVGIILQIYLIERKLKLVRNFRFNSVSLKLIDKMVKFSLPLCIATISYWLLSGYSRIIINKYIGEYEAGLYAIANRLASIVTVVLSIFQFAWNEAAYLMAKDNDRGRIYKYFVDILLKIMCWGSAMLIIILKIVFPFYIGQEYQEAIRIIPATIIGVSANAIAAFVSTFFMTEKHTSFIMISTVVASFFNIVLSVVSANEFGIQGVVVVLMISFIILLVIRIWVMIKQQGITLEKSFLFTLGILLLSVLIFYYTSNVIILVVYLVMLMVLAIFNMRKIVVLFINKWKIEKK